MVRSVDPTERLSHIQQHIKVNLFAVSDPVSIYQQTHDLGDVVEYPGEPLSSGNFVAYDRTYCVVYLK